METNEIKIKQLLLAKISELEDTTAFKLSQLLDISIDISYSYCEEISDDGYIDYIDTQSMDGKDAIVTINGKGLVFIDSGGYEKEYLDWKKEEENYSKKSSLSKVSTLVTTVTSLATVILTILLVIQGKEKKELEDKVTSDIQNEFKDTLIGKWKSQ